MSNIPFPEGKYDVLLADPPWHYSQRCDTDKMRGGCWRQYTPMTDDELRALDVGSLAAENSALFMWATCPRLDFAIELLKHYGFRYVTVAFWWMKTNPVNRKPFFGPGHYTASNVEPCLLGIRGSFVPDGEHLAQVITDPLSGMSVALASSTIVAPRREHSRKPDEARHRIERMYPNARRIELFARETVGDKWAVWGNETDQFTPSVREPQMKTNSLF